MEVKYKKKLNSRESSHVNLLIHPHWQFFGVFRFIETHTDTINARNETESYHLATVFFLETKKSDVIKSIIYCDTYVYSTGDIIIWMR